MNYINGLFIQLFIYLLLWLWDDYIAFLISVIVVSILVALLAISVIAERLEKSNVPNSYFKWMALSLIPPVLATMYFYIIHGGVFEWL